MILAATTFAVILTWGPAVDLTPNDLGPAEFYVCEVLERHTAEVPCPTGYLPPCLGMSEPRPVLLVFVDGFQCWAKVPDPGQVIIACVAAAYYDLDGELTFSDCVGHS